MPEEHITNTRGFIVLFGYLITFCISSLVSSRSLEYGRDSGSVFEIPSQYRKVNHVDERNKKPDRRMDV